MARANLAAGPDTQAKDDGIPRLCLGVSARRRFIPPAALAVISVLLLAVSVSRTQAAPQPVGHHARWHLVFDDEFSGSRLDTHRWSTGWFGSGVTGPVDLSERQCYDPSQVSVRHGELDLQLIARTEPCSTSSGQITRPYVSGIITTRGKFSFTRGYLEARVRMPGSGSVADWPAVWAVGYNWPDDGEVDVVEGLGGQACWHFHDPSGAPGGCSSKPFAGGWHTFGADWEKRAVTWYYDGRKVGTVRAGITSAPMYLVLGLGASDPSYGGPTVVPRSMRVDYVRVWQH